MGRTCFPICFAFVRAETLSAGYLFTPVEYQRSGGTSKLGLELAGIEPRSLVGASLNLLSPTPAEGASPLARSPRRGRTPFEIPHGRVFFIILVELAGIEPATS